jgi:hypothetical protein
VCLPTENIFLTNFFIFLKHCVVRQTKFSQRQRVTLFQQFMKSRFIDRRRWGNFLRSNFTCRWDLIKHHHDYYYHRSRHTVKDKLIINIRGNWKRWFNQSSVKLSSIKHFEPIAWV